MSATRRSMSKALESLQLRFADISLEARAERLISLGRKPKLIHSKHRVCLRIYREQSHRLPHFHIEFKKQYAASYVIETGERLAGHLPSKYEDEMLEWAAKNRAMLLREWENVNEGASVQYSLKEGRI